MLDLLMTGYCQGCTNGELTVDKIVMQGVDDKQEFRKLVNYVVKCSNEELCKHIYKKAKEYYDEESVMA